MDAIRGLVSKKKVRFQEDGFDLDLTYVTPRIIAMGAPSEGSDALYRNPMKDVQAFFELRHQGRFRIFDLRGEKGASYDPAKFGGNVAGYRFFDHNPAPLKLIRDCCMDMDAWLSLDPENVAAVHCKAGKGRTGLIIAAYLVHCGIAPSTTAALRMFGDVRTHNGKGVTIPSQMRYVHYYEQQLRNGAPDSFPPRVYKLRTIRMHTVPNFDVGGGCDPFFDVRLGDGKQCIFNMLAALKGKVKHYPSKQKVVDLDVAPFNIRVKGDVKIVFYDWDALGSPDKMFHFWFNTGFIINNYLQFNKEVLDRACKDKACKEFEPDFKLELFLERVEEIPGEFEKLETEYLDADHDEDLDEDGEDA